MDLLLQKFLAVIILKNPIISVLVTATGLEPTTT